MCQSFQNTGAFTLVGIIALLMLAVACAAPTPAPETTVTAILTVPPPPEHSTRSSYWLFSDERDSIGEERSISTLLLAQDSSLPRYQTPPYISVSCVGDVFLVSISWGKFLGFDDPGVDWRVNDEPALTETWELFGDDSVYAPEVSQKLSDLLRADKITARVHRESSSTLTAEWKPEGFAEVYQPIYEACKQ